MGAGRRLGAGLGARRCWAPTTTRAGFEPRHPVLVEVHRRHPHWRLGRTDRVFEALVPSIVEQKVTGKEAFAGFRTLVHFHGERAPGPGRDAEALAPADRRAAAPRSRRGSGCGMHIDPARSRTIVQAARVGDSLDRLTPDDADAKLRTLPGVGVWTSAEVRQRAFGDPDAVSFGDYHVAKDVGWALLGRRIDDDELAELLEEWRPHRGRVQAYVAMAGIGAPRRGPRMPLPTHYPSAHRWLRPRVRAQTGQAAVPPPTREPPPAGSAGRPGTAGPPPWRCRRRR